MCNKYYINNSNKLYKILQILRGEQMNIKSEKGITGIDVTIAIIIVMLFISLITSLYINIYNSSITTKRRTAANTYINTIFNEIKKADFSIMTTKQEVIDSGKDELIDHLKSVVKGNNITFYRTGDTPEDKPYKVEVDVSKYNETEGNEWKEDLVRTVSIKIHYRIGKVEKEESSKIVKSITIPIRDSLGIKPDIKEGMIPVKYVVTDNDINKNEGYWQATTVGDHEWFDYSKKQWANVTFSDGLEMDENGKITKMGSMFVYIPRYAYRISSLKHSYSALQGGNIEIKFIDTKNNPFQGESIYVHTPEDGSTVADTAYILNPAFDIGETKLSGLWVAKFEATNPNCETSPSTGMVDYSTLMTSGLNKVQSKPDVTSWRNISLNNAFNVSKKMMEIDYNYYGIEDNSDVESHLMKNTEWGAVVYLAESSYGKSEKVAINKNTDFITGATDNNIKYSSIEGVNASTTGNIYGVYDMAGGAYDMVSGYINNSSTSLISNLVNASAELKNEYPVGLTSNGKPIDTGIDNYNRTNARYGDAIWETSGSGTSNQSWYGNVSSFPFGETNSFVRGGINNSTSSGIYAFEGVTGTASMVKSFRTVITTK